MKVKDFVVPGNEILVEGLARLEAECTIFYALAQFIKLRISGSLPVYDRGNYLGNVALIDITRYLIVERKVEKDNRYRFSQKVMSSGIKLQNLLKKLPETEYKQQIADQCAKIIAASKDYI